MAVSREELAQRIKQARESLGMTQEEAAEKLGMARSALALAEGGKRRVDAMELARMVKLYEVSFRDLFDEAEQPVDPVQVLFRAYEAIEQTPAAKREVKRAARLVGEIHFLEGLALAKATQPRVPKYGYNAPSCKNEAVEQGIDLARQERGRLNLGGQPVWELAEILRREGLRVAELNLPAGLAGFTLRLPAGVLVAVNKNDIAECRLFSYAHEYCHVVADQDRSAVVSGEANRNEFCERRANVFAANFLMPEDGVRSFLESALGNEFRDKLDESNLAEAAGLARHFAVSIETVTFRLNNLGIITDKTKEGWMQKKEAAKALMGLLEGPGRSEKAHADLGGQLVEAALRAFRSVKISRNKLLELCEDVGRGREDMEAMLEVMGLGPKPVGLVGPR